MQGIPSGGKRRPLHSCLLLSICLVSLPLAAAEPSVERLTWAGIKVVEGDTTVFIDPVGTDLWNGEAPGGLVPIHFGLNDPPHYVEAEQALASARQLGEARGIALQHLKPGAVFQPEVSAYKP